MEHVGRRWRAKKALGAFALALFIGIQWFGSLVLAAAPIVAFAVAPIVELRLPDHWREQLWMAGKIAFPIAVVFALWAAQYEWRHAAPASGSDREPPDPPPSGE
jgi:hypothetical protein